jgi:two-component system CheB/CheR fusion protein
MTTRKKKPALLPKPPAVEKEQPDTEDSTQSQTRAAFPIVGIGASAGGLAAFEAFFSGMPADKEPGMAFVLVQHLAPDHHSILTDLVRRYTRMQVFEITDGVAVQPNCVYIIPPNRDMALLNGVLHLLEPGSPRGQRLPIDFFFRSLAQDQREQAICIILSGTGSDGTLGLRAVKGEGGLVMVQSPESTEYDGMPRSAIATGLVDVALLPAEMPNYLISYAAHAAERNNRSQTPQLPTSEDALKKIFILLRIQTGHDFSQYKRNTIKRRLERRMIVQQITDLDVYVRFLQQTPAEVETLFRDLLIGVTSFFRDPDAFASLETRGIPQLFSNKPDDSAIRVWVCGCSTGEEAYSIAILLLEEMERLKRNDKLQIFATDIDSRAISQARTGLYPSSIAADVTPERLTRFFSPEADGSVFRINKRIRDLLVFSEHDLLKDPPFSRLDLISCRNLLIYLNGELQKKVIPLFRYALKRDGRLFLGTSESLGDFVNLFSVLDRQAKLYQRKEDLSDLQRPVIAHFNPPLAAELPVQKQPAQPLATGKRSLREITEQTLLERYAPVSVLVTERAEMLYIHGNTGRYLEMAAGEPGLNILKMAREGLKRDLATALHSAIKEQLPVERHGLQVKTNGGFSSVNLAILPVAPTADSITTQTLYLVVLQELSAETPVLPAVHGTPLLEQPDEQTMEATALVARLKQELKANEDYLQSANEELETSNEELKSSNEEMQSVNEELQSTNEELETSKEELQSVNEELATVNNELQTKVTDLSRANNDMVNLMAGTGIGTVFVDFQQNILRFTPSIIQVINLITSDLGRPVGHIVTNLVGYDTLVEDIKAVLDSLVPREVEVQTKSGTWFLLRIRPYRTLDNVIEGAVISFFDINEIKKMRDALEKANNQLRLAVVLRDAHDAIMLKDLDGRIMAWNPAAERLYGWSEAEALQMNIRELIPEAEQAGYLLQVQQLCSNMQLKPYRTARIAKDGTIKQVWLTATALLNEAGQVYGIATTERECEVE